MALEACQRLYSWAFAGQSVRGNKRLTHLSFFCSVGLTEQLLQTTHR
jgi:hypothetical protein